MLIISRPFLFLLTIFATFIVMMGESNTPRHMTYTTVTGYFQQDDPNTDPKGFDFVQNPYLSICTNSG